MLTWRLYNTLEPDLCMNALEGSLSSDVLGLLNPHQGSQFTSAVFTSVLLSRSLPISTGSESGLDRQLVPGPAVDEREVQRDVPAGV